MRKEHWAILFFIALFAFLLVADPASNLSLHALLFRGVRTGGELSSELAEENIRLRAEIAALTSIESQLPAQSSPAIVTAFVYAAENPFGPKETLTVTAGRREGVLHNQAVTLRGAEGVLVGRITNVFEEYAVVETVFNKGFQMPVRIGSAGVDALLTGGREPRITLIPSTVKITDRDVVYSAAPDVPYGMPLGELRDIGASSDQLFYEAALIVPYDIRSVRAVTILINNVSR